MRYAADAGRRLTGDAQAPLLDTQSVATSRAPTSVSVLEPSNDLIAVRSSQDGTIVKVTL